MKPVRRPDLDPDSLRAGLRHANLPTLLAVLRQLTGDRTWLQDPYLPHRTRGLVDDDTGGLPEPVQDSIRAAAFDAVLAWHRGAPAAAAQLVPDDLLDVMTATTARAVPPEYTEIFAGDLTLDDGPAIPAPAAADPVGVTVTTLVVGAGFSGLLMAAELKRAGRPFLVVERADSVGGVWASNTYPGAGVDTPSHLYSVSWFPRAWSTTFARQPEVLAYARDLAAHLELGADLELGTEVLDVRWDAAGSLWQVTTEHAGRCRTRLFDVVVSAVGTFTQPAIPHLSGLAEFTGRVLHTAQWPAGASLTGQRVAVVGSGASAMQLVPKVVDEVAELVLFQRTPQWVAPVADYFAAMGPELELLLDTVPLYREWWRFRLSVAWNDGAYPALVVDPDWTDFPASVNAVNASQRRFYERYLRAELAGRDDLVELSLPDYPPFAKRLLLDNGWYAALRREQVTVVPRGVAGLTETGVVDAAGEEHEVDVVVLATGFTAAEYLSSLPVTVGDRTLRETWAGGQAAAYLGMAVPGFPNLFCMYGPNTHPGPGGSYLFLAESSAGYIGQAVAHLARTGRPLDVRPDVFRSYQDEVDAANGGLVWGTDAVDSYAKNAAGRVVTHYPWRVSDYWCRTRQFVPADYAGS